MFDVSLSELMVIGVVALVVIGPERLPRVARTAGHLLGRLQRYVNTVKADINREMHIEDLKNFEQRVRSDFTSFETGVNKELLTVENAVSSELRSVETDVVTLQDAAALHGELAAVSPAPTSEGVTAAPNSTAATEKH